jgi:hypothetical protein
MTIRNETLRTVEEKERLLMRIVSFMEIRSLFEGLEELISG